MTSVTLSLESNSRGKRMSYLLGKRGVTFKLLAVLLAATAIASACGSDSSSDDAAPVATTAAP
ncbi:MAG TPA: hypothetical protein QF762_07880, partial [Acidimicrobiales bacterium]|nr:hypothetical protein [Acidimicrobiales bacterium]